MTSEKKKEIEDFKASLSVHSATTHAEAEAIALEKYPVYTLKHPNPVTGKPDCNVEAMFKRCAREALIKKLLHCNTAKENT